MWIRTSLNKLFLFFSHLNPLQALPFLRPKKFTLKLIICEIILTCLEMPALILKTLISINSNFSSRSPSFGKLIFMIVAGRRMLRASSRFLYSSNLHSFNLLRCLRALPGLALFQLSSLIRNYLKILFHEYKFYFPVQKPHVRNFHVHRIIFIHFTSESVRE